MEGEATLISLLFSCREAACGCSELSFAIFCYDEISRSLKRHQAQNRDFVV